MTAVLLGTAEVQSPEWHALRAGGIGASEIAAVVGLSPYQSAFHLWHVKKGNIPGPKLSDAMDWGNRLEPVVRDWFASRHEFFDVEATPGTFAHSERNWQRVNPDGLIFDDEFLPNPIALYEGKTSRFGDGFGPSGSDVIPIGYRCQVQWALDIFDLPRAYVAVLIGGNEPREYVIEADREDQKALRDAGEKFWHSLQDNDEPPIDCSDSTYEAVRALNPEINPDIQHELAKSTWAKYQAAKQQVEEGSAALQQIKARILAAMGTARIATAQDAPVLRRQMSSGGTPYLKEIA